MPEPTYPGREHLATISAGSDGLAAATLEALDAHARDLDDLARRLDAIEARQVEAAGAPCADCGQPDAAHLIDPDRAEDWQPQHAYRAPETEPAPEEAPTAYPEPTPAQVETGRDLAGMAEADGAVSDGADVPWMIARELADAYWKGHAAGREYGGPPTPAPALPTWVIESTPCAACPDDIKHEHDDNGWTDDDGDHPGHVYQAERVHRLAVRFYVSTGADLDGEDLAEMLEHALDVARNRMAEAIDHRCTIIGSTDPEPLQ